MESEGFVAASFSLSLKSLPERTVFHKGRFASTEALVFYESNNVTVSMIENESKLRKRFYSFTGLHVNHAEELRYRR